MATYNVANMRLPVIKVKKIKRRICESCGKEHLWHGKYCLDCKSERIK